MFFRLSSNDAVRLISKKHQEHHLIGYILYTGAITITLIEKILGKITLLWYYLLPSF